MIMRNELKKIIKANRAMTVFTLIFLPILLALGSWQLERAQWRAEQQDARKQFAQKPPVLPNRDLAEHTPIQAAGEWLADEYLLMNRTRGGKSGVEVLGLFKTAQGVVLVNRGFLPWNYTGALPQPPRAKSRHIVGRVAPLDNNPMLESSSQDRKLIDVRDLPRLSARTGVDIQLEVRLLPEHPDALFAYWPTKHMTPEKHYGYAFQWFSLALALVIMYCGLIIKTKRKGEVHVVS